MTILIPPVEIGVVLGLKTFDLLYINYDKNTVSGMSSGQEIDIYEFNKVGIKLSPSMFTYKVTASSMGLIIQTLPK